MAFELPNDRRGLVVMAKVAEQCERFDEMLVCMKRLIHNHSAVLTLEEKNLLSVAYKNVLGARRSPWRILDACETTLPKDAVSMFKAQMENEIGEVCSDIFELLTSKLIPAAEDAESKVFYYKLKADYHRYYVEVLDASSSTAEGQRGQAREAYTNAVAACDSLHKSSPIRLGLLLNFSVFHYEIEKETTKGYEMAKEAFESGYQPELDDLEEEDYRESAMILSLLRDNLQTWAKALNINEAVGEGAGEEQMDMEDC